MAKRSRPQPAAPLDTLVAQLIDSYRGDGRTEHLNATFLPSRARTIDFVELMRRIVFPGFFDERRITDDNARFHAGELLTAAHDLLYEQARQALRYELNRTGKAREGDKCDACDALAARIAVDFLNDLPALRRVLALDVQAAFDGDPAAVSTDETIFCYPGLDAIFLHRIAHALWRLKVPLLPRIISEYSHTETGIDIHPGASIGESFFIDHGTGVVIGETCVIGDRVKIYQGVSLGALSTRGGQMWRGRKRHPTIEDDVTIYSGAIILGGETVIGQGATIGGAVFLTSSVPPHYTVTVKKPELTLSSNKRGKRKKADEGDAGPQIQDYQI